MKFIADFHIHSKYSRATSSRMDLENIARWAKYKGLDLIGTGDWTHHLWLEELKAKLNPVSDGIYEYDGTNFILTVEVSNIYSKNGKGRRVHNMIFAPNFKVVDEINRSLAGYGKLESDGRPMLGLDCERLVEIVDGICPEAFIVSCHAWTPWYSIFGSKSGFDSLEECYGNQAGKIFAIETGLSSDPPMNWRWSALDNITLISNSDAHSPEKLGREANVFNMELSYKAIMQVLKKRNKEHFLYTIEFFPEEGKYHYDGHRNCNILFSPTQSREHNGICPVCKRPLTLGVSNRIEELADRAEGGKPSEIIPCYHLIGLAELLSEIRGIGVNTQGVLQEYMNLVKTFGGEIELLLNVEEKDLTANLPPKVAEAIIRVRRGKVNLEPGYDGVFGKVNVFGGEEREEEKQLTLF